MSPLDFPKPSSHRNRDRLSSNLAGLGWQIASTLVVFTGLGYGFDALLDTQPWGLVVGALLGLVGVFAQFFRIALELNRADEQRKRRKETGAD